MNLGGEVTGRVSVGRFTFETGSPAGTRAFLATEATAESTSLRLALHEPEVSPTETALTGAEEALGEMGSALGHIERGLELFATLAQGKVFDKKLLKEVDVLLGALERLDREKRHREALRLARVLAAVLALLMRWVALVETLRVALRAAESLGDAPGIAWARHELGTFSLGAEDAAAANRELREALKIRQKQGDEVGAEVTRHNLAVLRQAFPGFDQAPGTGRKPLLAAGVGGVAALLVVGGVAVGMAVRNGDPSAGGNSSSDTVNIPTVDTTPPTVRFTTLPDNPTEERSATFAFEASEKVEIFECRLDDSSFKECNSPTNITRRLAVGRHIFRVRATDFAGNPGPIEAYDWVIERGVGPTVAINGPEELTNDATARFSLSAPGATRFECKLDDGGFGACQSRLRVTVAEGDHTFFARAFDANGNRGPEASYDWTVDTTGPTVEVVGSEVGGEGVEVVFTPSESSSVVECLFFETEEPDVDPGPEPDPVLIRRVRPCTSPVSLPAEPGNFYFLDLTATDPAGNVGETTRRVIDRTLD